ncbi:MAG: hypothetical protein WDO56_28345 [Gammaproteobacteria bacterium]
MNDFVKTKQLHRNLNLEKTQKCALLCAVHSTNLHDDLPDSRRPERHLHAAMAGLHKARSRACSAGTVMALLSLPHGRCRNQPIDHYPSTGQWNEQREAAKDVSAPDIAAVLKKDPAILLLFTNIFPFRASFSAVKFLHRQFDKSWSI